MNKPKVLWHRLESLEASGNFPANLQTYQCRIGVGQYQEIYLIVKAVLDPEHDWQSVGWLVSWVDERDHRTIEQLEGRAQESDFEHNIVAAKIAAEKALGQLAAKADKYE